MFVTVRVENWEILRLLAARMPRWLFRGQPSSEWGLQTSFERIATAGSWPVDVWSNRELHTLEEFKRRAHLVLPSPPHESANLEWLSVIQHYGGPTRLLDFTQSIYVASFFAIEPCLECDAAIWAVNSGHLDSLNNPEHFRDETPHEMNRRYISIVESTLCASEADSGVLQVEPVRLNERMSIQKGIFLFPKNIKEPFLKNLSTAIGVDVADLHASPRGECKLQDFGEKIINNPNAYRAAKLILPRETHEHAFMDLATMNIDASTLFPGLEGFARSLAKHLRAPAFFRYPDLLRRTES
jgi:hypothetical protein